MFRSASYNAQRSKFSIFHRTSVRGVTATVVARHRCSVQFVLSVVCTECCTHMYYLTVCVYTAHRSCTHTARDTLIVTQHSCYAALLGYDAVRASHEHAGLAPNQPYGPSGPTFHARRCLSTASLVTGCLFVPASFCSHTRRVADSPITNCMRCSCCLPFFLLPVARC